MSFDFCSREGVSFEGESGLNIYGQRLEAQWLARNIATKVAHRNRHH